MQKMENWAHRLYPKLQFNDFIDKVERLGSKKDVQVRAQRSAQLNVISIGCLFYSCF